MVKDNYWHMPFAITPLTVYQFIDISAPKLLLGSKESNPTAWRVLSDAISGKTKQPQKKTLNRVFDLLGATKSASLSAAIQTAPGARPWEIGVAAHQAGRKKADPAYEPASDVLCVEALRMEKLTYTAIEEGTKANDLSVTLDCITRWELCDLPSLQWVIGNIDTSNQDRFTTTASPLVIPATLYLMACGKVEYFGVDLPDTGISIAPLLRDGEAIRPMRRWLETLKDHWQFGTTRELSDFLLKPRSKNEDIETLRRVFRNWWSEGEIPAWSRVPHIVDSIVEQVGQEHRQDIRDGIYAAFINIRLMDKLLTLSQQIQRRWLSDYDPFAPFQDLRLMQERAIAAKVALSSQAGQ